MLASILETVEKGSITFSQNLSSWTFNIFAILVLIEFLLMVLAYTFAHTKVEELPIKFYKLIFFTFLANTLFMYLPQLWVIGWDTVNYVAGLASGGTIEDFSPDGLLVKAFVVVGQLFAAAGGEGAWYDLGAKIFAMLAALPIAFAVFFLFVIIITEVVLNYVMWVISCAMGGIFILLFVMSSTRPMFINYIKFMVGLLFKTLMIFLMISLLSTLLDKQINYSSSMGDKPKTDTCLLVESLQADASRCTTTECRAAIDQQLAVQSKSCNQERKELEKWTEDSQKGFLVRGLSLLMAMIIFVLMFKTLPSAIAGLVGFGSYDIKGGMQAMGAIAAGAGAAKMAGGAMAQTNAGVAVGGAVGGAAKAGGAMAGQGAGILGKAAVGAAVGFGGLMTGQDPVSSYQAGSSAAGKVGGAIGKAAGAIKHGLSKATPAAGGAAAGGGGSSGGKSQGQKTMQAAKQAFGMK